MSHVVHVFVPQLKLAKDLRKYLKSNESPFSAKSIDLAFSGFAKNKEEAFDIARKEATSQFKRYEYLPYDSFVIDDSIKVKNSNYYKKVYDANNNVIGHTENGWNVFIMVEND